MKKITQYNRNQLQKIPLMIMVLLFSLLSTFPVHAQTVADAVQQVAASQGMAYESTTEDVTGYNLSVYYCTGTYQNGDAALYAMGPLKAAEIQAVSERLFDYSGTTGSATTPMKGGEVRRYAMSDQVLLSVVLNNYMVVIQIATSGNNQEQDFQKATEYAQLMLDALEKNGLLGGKAPDLEAVITNTAPSSVTGTGIPGDNSANQNGSTGTGNGSNGYNTENAPAAIGPVGNIPGPADNTQSVVGVIVPGLLATALGALSGLAGGGASPLGGSSPEAPQTGMKRSRFSEDASSGMETDVDQGAFDNQWGGTGRETDVSQDTFDGQGEFSRDQNVGPSAGELITDDFGIGLPEDEIISADTDQIVVDTSDFFNKGELILDNFGNTLPDDEIIAADTNQIVVDTSKLGTASDEEGVVIADDFGGTIPEDEIIAANPEKIVVDKTATETILQDDFSIIGEENQINPENHSPASSETIVVDSGVREEVTSQEKIVIDKPADDTASANKSDTSTDQPTSTRNENPGETEAASQSSKKQPPSQPGDAKDGFDENGFDKKGFDQDGFNKDGYNQEGYDRYGYNRQGFNKNGYDRDGYDLEGFDYKGYNRDGYDPFGYNRQGYGKDGYHWSGYNTDGYDKNGKHWSDLGYDPNNRNPFDGGPISLDGSDPVDIKPTAPPLGQPYPRTAEKYGPKTWDTPATSPETPTSTTPTNTTPTGTSPASSTTTDQSAPPEVSTPPEPEVTVPPPPAAPDDSIKDTGIIGPEDPQNTLNQHPLGGQTSGESAATPSQPETPSQTQSGGQQPPPAQSSNAPSDGDLKNNGIDGDQTHVPEVPSGQATATNLPKDGETHILTGQTDGRSYEITYDGKTGQWINTESGNIFDPDKFDQWQKDLAVDKAISAESMEKMAARTDANSQAIDQHLADYKNLQQIQKTADKFDFGTAGGPGDVDGALQDLKDEMLSGKNLDYEKLEKIKNVIDSRIKGRTTEDPGKAWEEVPWYEDVNSALKANVESIRNIVTGEDEDGNTSYLGMAGRMVIGAATGGASEYVMTVAEALNNVKKGINEGKSGWDATKDAITKVVTDEAVSFGMDKAGELGTGFVKKTFPKATQKLGDLVDAAGSKLDDLNQRASRKLGLIADEGADQAVDKINKNMAKKAAGTADEVAEDAARTAKKSADELTDGKALKAGDKPGKDAYEAATQKIKDQKDKVSQKADELIENYRTNSQQNLNTIERDEYFKEGRKVGKQKVDDMKVAQENLRANPDSAEAQKAYEEAMTAVQKDKHAMHTLNDLEGPEAKEIREAFNTKMSHKAEVADLNAKERIAREYGVSEDQVKTVGATNTMDTSGKADPTGFAKKTEGIDTDGTKAGKYTEDNVAAQTKGGDKTSYDIDKTYRVQVGETVDPVTGVKTPIYKDIPAADTKRIFGEEYYKQFHDGKLPTKIENGIEVVDSKAVEKFSKEMDVSAVDHRSAEGYGAGDHDLKEMIKKDGTVKKLDDIEAGTKTMEYKANEWENHAAELREQAKKATGAERAELLAKAEGLSEESMRQTTKQFNNQICEQMKAINLSKGQEVVKIPDKLFTAINVMEKVGKPKGGLSVVEAEEILKGMGLTPKEVSQQMSSLMESMQKFNK